MNTSSASAEWHIFAGTSSSLHGARFCSDSSKISGYGSLSTVGVQPETSSFLGVLGMVDGSAQVDHQLSIWPFVQASRAPALRRATSLQLPNPQVTFSSPPCSAASFGSDRVSLRNLFVPSLFLRQPTVCVAAMLEEAHLAACPPPRDVPT